MATEKRPPITCHVLDTTCGKPAAHIPVTLTLLPSKAAPSSPTVPRRMSSSAHDLQPPTLHQHHYAAVTNADGRVTHWVGGLNSISLETLWEKAEVFAGFREGDRGEMRWSLRFDTEDYFDERGVKAFFPEVDIKFVVTKEQREAKEHFHVPVLLGPFGFTSYRGS